jgi:hypothetical protein
MAGKRKAAKGPGAKPNGKTIFQATPIIIKGGDSLHVYSDLVDFEDDDGKRVSHVKIKNKGSIREISIKGSIDLGSVKGDGSKDHPLDIPLTGKNHTICITFFRED